MTWMYRPRDNAPRKRALGVVAAVALLAAVSSIAAPLAAQSITVSAGSAPSAVVLPGGKITVPVVVDLTNAGSENIASLSGSIGWGASQLTLDSLRTVPGLGWSFSASLSSGLATFTTSNATALASSSSLMNAYFTAGATSGGTRVTVAPTAAARATAESILQLLRPRGLDVCVALSGRWGDVNSDDVVNIIDAQQIARASVGLSVANANALSYRGDVTADGSVNIIDAQQVARFSVALGAAARVNTDAFTAPTVASASITPSGAQTITAGGTLQLAVTPRNAASADLTGCASFTWTSSNPGIATVNADGFVATVAVGTTTITATSITNPAVSASVALTVAAAVPTVHLTVAQSGRTARQYIAQVSGASISGFLGFSLTGTAMTGGTMDLVLPSAGSYTVRVVAIDAGTTTNSLFLAGGQFTISVPAGIVNRSLTLTPATFTMTTLRPSAAIGAPIPVAWKIADPSGALDARNGDLYCGGVQWTTGTLTQEFDGESTDACDNLTNPTTGTLAYTTSLASQPAPGFVRLTVRGVQDVRAGASDVVVYWISPSVTRGESPLTVTIAPIASVAVTPSAQNVPIGGTQQMTATARDTANAVVSGWPVTWSSSIPAVATVSAAGLVTGIANGSTTITATANGISGSTTVTVSGGIVVGSIAVSLGSNSLTGNNTTTATAEVKNPGGTVIGAAVTWSSSSPNVARVAADGTVQALGSGTSTITATIGEVSNSATLTVGTTAQAFNIEIRPLTTLPTAVATAFATASTRWSQIIRGDLPNVPVNNLNLSNCVPTLPNNLTETIDDLIIYVSVATIDGTGGTLGNGGPCVVRNGSGHAYIGRITLDQADVANMESNGTLNPVVLHEVGHVLGIGTNWENLLLNPAPSTPDPAGDPTFDGVNAKWVFQKMGTGYEGAVVPVENCCGSGTRNAHWRESVLKRELMTGFTTGSGGLNPLSPLTAASLIDIGYVVDVSQSDGVPYFEPLPGAPLPVRIEMKELPWPAPMVTDLNGRAIGGQPAHAVRAAPKTPVRQ
ncbi:MAG: Ig-like domain-containing protein [Gemmatimonadota bacterium]